MTRRKMLLVGLTASLWLPLPAHAADGTGEPAANQEAEAPKCLEAVVNPVTGFAFCTNPRGAPVDPPAKEAYQRPCKPRAHDDDAWTVYEHASGCGD